MNRHISLLAFCVILAAPSAAIAQSGEEDRWFFELGAGTDNRSKNVSKSDTDAYVFGSATWQSVDRRFYVRPSFEGIQSGGSDVEVAFATGFTPEAWGYEFDLNVAYLNRIDVDAGYDEDAWELTGNMARAIGPARGNLQVQYSPDAAGPTRSFVWVEAELGWEFSQRLSGSAAVGRREQVGAPDYTGWNAGMTLGLTEAIDLDVRYYDTSKHAEGAEYRDAVVAEVRLAF